MRPNPHVLLCLLAALAAPALLRAEDAPPDNHSAPQVFLDKNPKIVAYQLKRLSNAQLLTVGRSTDHPKYKPVYEAILTRKGLEKKNRIEALEALVKLDKSDPTTELLSAVGKVEADDKGTPYELASILVAQPPASLAAKRDQLELLARESETPAVKQAAYAGLATADGKAEAAWKLASENAGGLRQLLAGLPMIADGKLRGSFYPLVKPLVAQAPDEESRLAAIEALSQLPGQEPDAFKTLADLISTAQGKVRDAAVRSIRRIPATAWPKDQVEPLAKTVLKLIEQTPAEQRTTPAIVQAVQLGEDLSKALPPDEGAALRKSLRALAVRMIVLRPLRDQMQYDLHYFVVQANKPVQILLENTDVMPHNIVIVAPGAVQEIGTAGSNMAQPADPNAKAYIPDSPKVLHATGLTQPEESATLSFTAPDQPGEYGYVCTFPAHWMRMYGVMLVVPDLEAWERNPTHPTDPLARKPYESQKAEILGAPAVHEH